MTKSVADKVQRPKARFKSQKVQKNIMSMHYVSLLLEAILLKARSLEQLGLTKEAAKECNAILDTVKDALPKGLPVGVFGDCKFQEMFHMALESFPVLWKKAGCLEEAMIERENPEVAFSLGLAAAVSRDINAALESSRDYLHMTMGSSVKGRRLLALVVSAGQSLSEAETVVNLALDETIELDHIGLLRLKCKLQIAQGRPTQAIETYTFLFTLIQAQTRSQTMKSVS